MFITEPLLVVWVIVDVMSVNNPFEPITKVYVFLPFGHTNDNIPVLVNPTISSITLHPIILYLSLLKLFTPSIENLFILPICLSFYDVGIAVNECTKAVSGKVIFDKNKVLTPV